MNALYMLIDTILSLFTWLVIGFVVLSWLVNFNIINTSNQFVYMLASFLHRVVDPLLQPIRRYIPYIGGVDISPIILLLIIYFLRNLLAEYWPHSF